jgi:hypothetical protein
MRIAFTFAGALGTVSLVLAMAHCSKSGSGAGGASSDGGGGDDEDGGAIPLSCGSTDDCLSAGLDADTCVYSATPGNCSAIGQCQPIDPSAHKSDCAPAVTICPCGAATCTCAGDPTMTKDAGCVCEDDTVTIPACWQGFSPVAVASVGRCSLDGGT